MSDSVRYEKNGEIASLALDDGKANALGPALLSELDAALDRAEKEAQALVLTGRAGRFSAGFDLSVLGGGGAAGRALVQQGAELGLRLAEFPKPVVAACNGHALAMGAVLLLCADFRVGVRGAFKIGLNEVAIGMTLPHFAQELARARLSKRHLMRAAVHAEIYAPDDAVDAGFLDETVEAEALAATTRAHAERLAGLHPQSFIATRRRILAGTLAGIRGELSDDLGRLLPDG